MSPDKCYIYSSISLLSIFLLTLILSPNQLPAISDGGRVSALILTTKQTIMVLLAQNAPHWNIGSHAAEEGKGVEDDHDHAQASAPLLHPD